MLHRMGPWSERVTLTAIKPVHSAVFLTMLAAILWLLVTGLTGRRDRSVRAAAALVVIESAVFVANRGVRIASLGRFRFGQRR